MGPAQPPVPRMRLALLAVPAVLTAMFTVLLVRVAQLQIAPSAHLREHMTARVSTRADTPQRGDLLDRRRRPISVTRFGYRVVVDPLILDKPHESIVRLAQALGEDPERIGLRVTSAIDRNAAILAERPTEPTVRGGLASLWPWGGGEPGEEPAASLTPGDSSADEPPTEGVRRGRSPIRYLPISDVLPEPKVVAVRALKIPGVLVERRPVREYPAGESASSIVGLVGFEDHGLLGAEKRLDERLVGTPGKISFSRDKSGRPLWIEPGQVRPAEPGEDVRLSIDLEMQRIAEEELARGVEDADAAGGRLVMVDPITGEVLAMADVIREVPELSAYPWAPESERQRQRRLAARKLGAPGLEAPDEASPTVESLPVASLGSGARYQTIRPDPKRAIHASLGRNRCVEDIYEPGSTFKPFVWSTITDLGLARTDEVIDTEGGRWHTSYGRYIEDVSRRDRQTWSEVLVNSSNIGMIKTAERLSWEQLANVPVKFGFGRPTNIGLPGEATGIVTPLSKWTKYSHTSYAYGYEVAVTPVQIVRAFSAFCRPDELSGTIPQLHLTAVDPAPGTRFLGATELQKGVVYRVLRPETALLTRHTMKGVADSVEAKMKTAKTFDCDTPWRYVMFGKSGTAQIPLTDPPEGFVRPQGTRGYFEGQYNSSFLAAAPLEDPRLAIIVVIDDPGPARIRRKEHYGTWVAGPVVRRVLERSLTYMNVPPSRTPDPLAHAENSPE